MDEDFSTDLDAWLDNNVGRYDVARTLKQTADETTQVVYRRAGEDDVRTGPFVRKIFEREAGRGDAYARILEAQVSGVRLEHQPFVYECEHEGGRLCVVMEYVHGQTLRELVDEEGPSVSLVARVVPPLCDAVTELHERLGQPVIHRDVKPSNVMIAGDRLMLIDLGIARAYRVGAEHDTVRYGTPGYAPPEQFGYGQTSVTSDVYALGMTLAFCLVGEDPKQELREGGFVDPCIPERLRPVLVRATQFDPAARYASARELKEALQEALANRAVTEPEAPAPAPSPREQMTPVPVPVPVSSASEPTTSRERTSPKIAEPARPAAPAATGDPGTPVAVPASQANDGRTDSTSRSRQGRRGIPAAVGIAWNVLVVGVWGVLLAALAKGIPNPVQSLEDTPVWLRVIIYLCFFVVPFTSIGYVLLDKRRLRERTFLGRSTLRREILPLILVSVASIALCLVIYSVAMMGHKG